MAGSALIIGSSGFLGARIASRFRAEGYRTVGVDRLANPDCVPDDFHVLALPDAGLEEILGVERPSVVVHAAGPASVTDSVADPLSDFIGSVGLSAVVLDAVRRSAPKARTVVLSSAAVYGNPEHLPVAETATLAPISPYGFHKRMLELLVRECSSVYDMPICALRVFSAYGPGLRRQLVWDVCEMVAAGRVSLFGTGSESRDFVHVDDVAAAVFAAAFRAPCRGEVFNVATGTETTVREIARLVVDSLAPGTEIKFTGTPRPGDPRRWRADISRISSLGYMPSVALTSGIRGYCDWYTAEREKSA